MAINTRTKAQILQDTNDVNTTESLFRTGLDDVIDQVDTTQVHMNADRSITLSGDVSGSVTGLQWNNTDDYDITISVNLNMGAIGGADIAVDAIDNTHIANNAIRTEHILDGQITNAKIASTARRRLTIYDTNGTTVLFENDGLIPL